MMKSCLHSGFVKGYFLILLSFLFVVISCDDNTTDPDPDPDPTTSLFRMGAGVTDIEGNIYKSVIIRVGTTSKAVIEQEWMMSNLRVTKYSDGTDISASSYTYCNNDTNTVDSLGLLYTWDAFTNGSATAGNQGACPTGWHVPTIEEYRTLFTGLGGDSVAGMKMKSMNSTYWNDVTLNSNASGFNAQGSGWVSMGMAFHYMNATMFWTSTENGTNARIVQLNAQTKYAIHQYDCAKDAKNSSRCIKD